MESGQHIVPFSLLQVHLPGIPGSVTPTLQCELPMSSPNYHPGGSMV